MSKQIRLGIIGTGNRARLYALTARQVQGLEVTAITDKDPVRLQCFQREVAPDARICSNGSRELLSADDVDAVIISTPEPFHRTLAEEAFAAGKHVLLEKPMALTMEDCRGIVRAREKADRVLQLGFVLRYCKFYQQIRQVIRSGEIGQIMAVEACEHLAVMHGASYMRRWHRLSKNSGGFFLHKCSHDMDILCWLTDSVPTRVFSFGDTRFFTPEKSRSTHCSTCEIKDSCRYRFGGEAVFLTEADKADPSANNHDLCVFTAEKDIVDNQVAIIEYRNGVKGTFSLQLFHFTTTRKIRVTGELGQIEGDLASNTARILFADGRIREIDVIPDNDSAHNGGDFHLLREFRDNILHGTPPTAGYAEGLISNAIALAVDRARLQGCVVNLTDEDYRLT
jgi:predicted dehydrogenase